LFLNIQVFSKLREIRWSGGIAQDSQMNLQIAQGAKSLYDALDAPSPGSPGTDPAGGFEQPQGSNQATPCNAEAVNIILLRSAEILFPFAGELIPIIRRPFE